MICGCCETVGAYIGQHLDRGGTLRNADALDARRLVAELDRVFAADGGSSITAEELADYCLALDE